MTETSGDLMTQLINLGYSRNTQNPNLLQYFNNGRPERTVNFYHDGNPKKISEEANPYIYKSNFNDKKNGYDPKPAVLTLYPITEIEYAENGLPSMFHGLKFTSEVNNTSERDKAGRCMTIRFGEFSNSERSYIGLLVENKTKNTFVNSEYKDLLMSIFGDTQTDRIPNQFMVNITEQIGYIGHKRDTIIPINQSPISLLKNTLSGLHLAGISNLNYDEKILSVNFGNPHRIIQLTRKNGQSIESIAQNALSGMSVISLQTY